MCIIQGENKTCLDNLSIMDLLNDIKEIKKTEYCLFSNSGKKRKIYQNK